MIETSLWILVTLTLIMFVVLYGNKLICDAWDKRMDTLIQREKFLRPRRDL